MEGTEGAGTCEADWLRDRRAVWSWSAALVVAAAGWIAIPGVGGALLSATGFMLAGLLCLGNTVRCRRVHCAITGPLYVVAAGLFLARAAGSRVAGSWIIAGAFGGTALAFVPEWLGKKYFNVGRPSVSVRRPRP